MAEICYQDEHILVCIKPPRVLSTDEPGGLPELLRAQIGQPDGDIRTVHRLDRVVSGLMVLARNASAAAELSRQVREGEFRKIYLAALHGVPEKQEDTLADLLGRDKARRMTYVAQEVARGIQPASLSYTVLDQNGQSALVQIQLHTGRTHQIRVQFASRGYPLWGERKYYTGDDPCEIALFSHEIGFYHPKTGQWMEFTKNPPNEFPWNSFPKKTFIETVGEQDASL